MKLIKIEKTVCGACNMVESLLRREGVQYESYNTESLVHEEAEQAQAYLMELGLFTVPVTILADDEGRIVDHARGYDVPKIEMLIKEL